MFRMQVATWNQPSGIPSKDKTVQKNWFSHFCCLGFTAIMSMVKCFLRHSYHSPAQATRTRTVPRKIRTWRPQFKKNATRQWQRQNSLYQTSSHL